MFTMVFIFGCARGTQQDVDIPLPFDAAIKLIAHNIFVLEAKRIGPISIKSVFVIDQIIDSDTGEVTKTNKRIAELVAEEGRTNFPSFTIFEMNSENLKMANYVIVGTIKYEQYRGTNAKYPHLSMSVIDVRYGMIASRSDVWISSDNSDYEPTPMYKDSPMYLKDQRVEALIATAKATAGSVVNKEYFDSLATSALLNEAGNSYDEGNYKLSLGLFAKAAERTDGKTMKSFSGLYQNFYKLGQLDKAEDAFGTLTELGIKNHNLGVKFLFKVNDTEFLETANGAAEYSMWLRQIADRINNSSSCVQVIGHASKSGTDDHNKKLSLKRAQTIELKLSTISNGIKKKLRSLGRGFDENIIGTGRNDESDAIDRRVEFKVVGCESLPSSK
jgi:outer membrane protein OmpA-like peptidoglycan-associated protein